MKNALVLSLAVCLSAVNSQRACAGVRWDDPRTYGTPVNLGVNVNTYEDDWVPSLTADELTMVFVRGWGDLYFATRASKSDVFYAVTKFPYSSSSVFETQPSLTGDGLELYYGTQSPYTGNFVCTRTSPTAPWSAPRQVPAWTSQYGWLKVSSDGLTAFLTTGVSMYISTRSSRAAEWKSPTLAGLPMDSAQVLPNCLSADGLSLLFARSYDNWNSWNQWVSTRDTPESPWETPVWLPAPVNLPGTTTGGASLVGDTLYFFSNRSRGTGGFDLYAVSVPEPASGLCLLLVSALGLTLRRGRILC